MKNHSIHLNKIIDKTEPDLEKERKNFKFNWNVPSIGGYLEICVACNTHSQVLLRESLFKSRKVHIGQLSNQPLDDWLNTIDSRQKEYSE